MEKYFDVNEQGYSVRCKLYCNETTGITRAVVFLHGFGGHKETKAAARFADRVLSKYKHVAVVAFDWPCHGMDARKKLLLSECDTYLTLVLAELRRRWGDGLTIHCYATSFGGYMAMKYIADHGNPFGRVALRCPALKMYESMVNTLMKHDDMALLEKGKEALIGFDRKVKITAQFLQELKENDVTGKEFFDVADDVLILHGTADEIVSFDVSRQFAEDNVIELIPVEGADHRFRDPNKMDYAISKIAEFFFQ